MVALKQRPTYTVYIVSGDKKYNVTPALNSIDRSDSDSQIAQKVILHLTNILVDGTWLVSLLKARDRVYVYANDGERNEEVFRGYLWTRKYNSSLDDRDIEYTCYDNLIYFQESEDALFFASGKKTKDVFQSICDKWGVPLSYTYDSITHEKLPLKGRMYDFFTADILDLVKKKNGKKYVILSDQDTMYIKPVGANSTIYHFKAGKNVSKVASGWTMDGMITQVVILGKASDDESQPVEATVSGDTSTYGTLQKIEERDENTSLEKAKQEANTTIKEKGKPRWEYIVDTPDIPWIREGDKVYLDAGDVVESYLIVTAIDRSCDSKNCEMTLTLENLE